MDTANLKEAREKLGVIIDRARMRAKPTLITRYGQAAAVVVSVEWYEAHKDDGDPSADLDDQAAVQLSDAAFDAWADRRAG